MATTAIQRLMARYNTMLLKGNITFLAQEEWEQLVAYFMDTDALRKAATAVEYAIEQHVFCADFWVLKAHIYHDLAEPKASLAAAEHAEGLGLRSLEVYLLLAEAHTDLKDYTEALAVLHDALNFHQKDKSLAAIYVHIANIYEEQERYDKVFETLRLAAQHNPNAIEILDRLGAVVKQLQNYTQSIATHQNILDVQPYATRAWHNLGAAHAALGDTAAAIEAYEYALTIEEGYFNAAISLAQVWISVGLYEKAAQVLQDTLQAADTELLNADMGYWQAYVQFRLEDYATAKASANAVLLQDMTHHAAHFLLGEIATISLQWQQAVVHYKKATAYANGNGDYWAALAHALMRNEQPDDAIDAFRYAIKTDPQHLTYWLGTINTYFVLEQYEAASNAIADAESFIDAPQLGYCKTIYYFLTRRRKAALQILQHTLTLDVSNVDYLFDLMPHLVKDAEVLRLIQNAQQQDKRRR